MNRRNFLKGFLAATVVTTLAPLPALIETPIAEAKFVSFEEIARVTLEKYRPILADSFVKGSKIRWEMLYAQKCIDGGKSFNDIFLNSV